MIQGALAEPTLFERLGGYAAVAATADDLAERLYVDAALDASPAIDAFHDEHEKAGRKYVPTPWVVARTGGPAAAYPGHSMREAHAHLTLTSREFDIVMTECRTTFYKFNVPERELEELGSILESCRQAIAPPCTEKPAGPCALGEARSA